MAIAAPALPAAESPAHEWRAAHKAHLEWQFSEFERGVPVRNLLAARSEFVDAMLRDLWHGQVGERDDLALLAVGGYGRGELHPYSDVDVLLLSSDEPDADTKNHLESLVTQFWDLGVDIGHSVRSLSDCANEAHQDLTIITNLVEARVVVGPQTLHDQLRQALAPEHMWPAREFYTGKMQEQKDRHGRFNESQYRLEPNVKQSVGGLRDIQTIEWVMRRAFNADIKTDLFGLGMMDKEECLQLLDGRDFLWQVRFALHKLAGRAEDRLLFEYQRALASQFGYSDDGTNLGVEQFMKSYFFTSTRLSRLNDLVLQYLNENLLHADSEAEVIPLGTSEFQLRNGYLEACDTGIFEREPLTILLIFRVFQDHPEAQGIRAETLRALRAARPGLTQVMQDSSAARQVFIDFFRAPSGLTHTLRLMHRYGVLGSALPGFQHIIGQMQFDMFHIFTVDMHTLAVLRNLRRFAVPEFFDEYPLCSEIISTLERPEIVYLAGLFHDIGKGRGGDHSKLGAEMAREFGDTYELGEEDTTLLSWLVENHLVMSSVSQRQDISDPDVIARFAVRVGTVRRLQCLYVLTVADVRGTNPELWNSWRNALLGELYRATHNALEPKVQTPEDLDDKADTGKSEAAARLQADGIPPARYKALWDSLPRDYFARYDVEEIVWQVKTVLQSPVDQQYGIHIPDKVVRGGSVIFVHGPDRVGLFAKLAFGLEELGLSIQEARIASTNDGRVLDSFIVLESSGDRIQGEVRHAEIRDALAHRANADLPPLPQHIHKLDRRTREFFEPTRVTVKHGSNASTVNIEANDRPGLLSAIARTMMNCEMHLLSARIATIGSRANDSFVVQGPSAAHISDDQVTCITNGLKSILD